MRQIEGSMTLMSDQDILDFADRLFRAVEAGDAAAARQFYASDARIWHNVDGVEQTADECVQTFAQLKQLLPDQKLKIIRREVIPGGFLQQDRLTATLPDGSPFSLSACLVVRMENGFITRVDEYLDSAEIQPLLAFAQ